MSRPADGASAKQIIPCRHAAATRARTGLRKASAQRAHASACVAALSPAREHLRTCGLECSAHERERCTFLRGWKVHTSLASHTQSEPRTPNPNMPSIGIGRCALGNPFVTRAQEAAEHAAGASPRPRSPHPLPSMCIDGVCGVLQITATETRTSCGSVPGVSASPHPPHPRSARPLTRLSLVSP